MLWLINICISSNFPANFIKFCSIKGKFSRSNEYAALLEANLHMFLYFFLVQLRKILLVKCAQALFLIALSRIAPQH